MSIERYSVNFGYLLQTMADMSVSVTVCDGCYEFYVVSATVYGVGIRASRANRSEIS